MLNAIHHVALICTDYDRSRRFYVELLGLELIREVYRSGRSIGKSGSHGRRICRSGPSNWNCSPSLHQ